MRPLTNVLTRKSNARLGRPHFGSKSPLYEGKLQSNARDMPGGEIGCFGTEWYIIHLISDLKGNSQFCFPKSPDVSRDDYKTIFLARDLQAFLVFSQHPAWVITPVNP